VQEGQEAAAGAPPAAAAAAAEGKPGGLLPSGKRQHIEQQQQQQEQQEQQEQKAAAAKAYVDALQPHMFSEQPLEATHYFRQGPLLPREPCRSLGTLLHPFSARASRLLPA
jgi:hypothetical protein